MSDEKDRFVLLVTRLAGAWLVANCGVACCNYDGDVPHVIATDDRGCVTYQISCRDVFYTRCPASTSTANTDCHWVQTGRTGHEECASSTTVEGPVRGCCPPSWEEE